KKMQLICWNRQFREILTLPAQFGRVGAPLEEIVRYMALRVDEDAAAVEALARANEHLERRVQARTQELAIAKAKADEANLSKTRFLAAASHDVLQPLNAARLYAASLLERSPPAEIGRLARNID